MKNIIQIVLSSLFLFGTAFGQQHITVSTYSGQTEIKASRSVTLTDGFQFTASPGSSLRIFTLPSYLNAVPFAGSPSGDQNYISTLTFRKPVTDEGTDGLTNAEVNQTIQYFDGLGRQIQSVQVQASPSSADIIQPIQYDQFGRESKKYQSYAASGTYGTYRTDAFTAQSAFYGSPPVGVTATSYPYAITVFEYSPLNRVLEQGFNGAAWQPVANSTSGHTVKIDNDVYSTNDIKLWTMNATDNGATATIYAAGTLYKTISKDENWEATHLKMGTIEEFKDMYGRVVLKRIWETDSKCLSTYYVYDDFGTLRYVLPPAVNDNGQSPINTFTENDEVFKQFIYGYHYDGRKRVIAKKLPGKGWENIVYNKLDQVVLSQDILQKTAGQWLFTKYDALGKVIQTGIYTDGNDRATLQSTLDNQSPYTPAWETRTVEVSPGIFEYTNLSFPTTNTLIHSVTYYDGYDFPNNTFGSPTGAQATGDLVKTLVTGIRTNVLGTSTMLLSVNYYDQKARIVQSKTENYLSGTDVVDNTYSFVGELLSSTRVHNPATGAATTIANRYEYDHVGRKLATFQRINTQDEVTLSVVEYNEIGQLMNKKLHNELQSTGYTYNERGWLTSSSSPQFSMNLQYNNGTYPQYNGNISGQIYNNNGSNTFTYQYDKLNRLYNATSSTMSEVLDYDVMGNIKSLNRDGTGAKVYNYTDGNRLESITGLTGSYVYDTNGNVVTDGRNGVALSYNHLNLPITANKSGLSLAYTYDATGVKLRKVSTTGTTTTTDYVNGIQYTNGVIDFIQTEEGIAFNSGGIYSYRYNLSDHLGNVRATFKVNGNSIEVLQRDDYYAFGMRKSVNNDVGAVSLQNKYLYNGKELQEELEQYDYGARLYDPVIGRWNVMDPMTEKYYGINAYAFSVNNPSTLIDPDGRDVDISNVTDDDQKKAFVEFMKTQNGQAFLNSFLKKGQSINIKIGKKNYVYINKGKDGEFAKDLLAFGSSDDLGRVGKQIIQGRTITTKPDNKELGQDGYGGKDNNYDARNKIVEQIWLRTGQSVDEAIATMGHEAFVHGHPDLIRLRELRQELNNGTIQPGTKAYEMKLDAITNSGTVDHKNLSNGKAGAFRNFTLQMDALQNTTKFIKSYNEDVKANK